MIFKFRFFNFNAFSKKFKSLVRVIFFRNLYFLVQIRNQRPKSHNNGGWGDRFAEKNSDHNPPYCYTVLPAVCPNVVSNPVTPGILTVPVNGVNGRKCHFSNRRGDLALENAVK